MQARKEKSKLYIQSQEHVELRKQTIKQWNVKGFVQARKQESNPQMARSGGFKKAGMKRATCRNAYN